MHHFTPKKHDFGFEAAAWYWDLADILCSLLIVSCEVNSDFADSWVFPGCLLLRPVNVGAGVGWSEQICSLTRRLKDSCPEVTPHPFLAYFLEHKVSP